VAIASKQYRSSGPNVPYFGALDGFRGLLALFVALYHTYWFSHINSTEFFNNGPVIIDLFFVFSGFLLFTLYGKKLKSGADGAKFIKKRFARLYPLHLFTLCLFILFACFRVVLHSLGFAHLDQGEILPFQPGSTESVSTVLSNLTLTQAMGIHDHTSFNVPAWTISVEFFAYFTFAAMLIWAPPRKAVHFGIIGVLVAAIYGALSQLKPDMNITYDYSFLRCLGGFYTGVLVAGLFDRIKQAPILAKMKSRTATILELLTVLGSTMFVIYCPGKLQFLVAPVLFLFVLVFAFDKGLVSRFMMAKPFRYLAKISYSVYMVHMIIAVVFNIAANVIVSRFLGAGWYEYSWLGDLFLVPYLLSVLVFAHFTQKYVEVYGQKFVMKQKFGISTKLKALSKT